MLTTNLKKPFYNNIISDSKEENNSDKEVIKNDDELIASVGTVSYTHLTLPTIA